MEVQLPDTLSSEILLGEHASPGREEFGCKWGWRHEREYAKCNWNVWRDLLCRWTAELDPVGLDAQLDIQALNKRRSKINQFEDITLKDCPTCAISVGVKLGTLFIVGVEPKKGKRQTQGSRRY